MADYRAPLADMRFLFESVFELEDFWQQLSGTADLDGATALAILEEAAKLSETEIAPLNRAADEAGCQFDQGEVRAPEGFKAAYEALGKGGWIGLGGNPDYGGLGMPKSLACMVEEMIQGACMSLGLAPMLSAGACLALDAHAGQELKSLYLPKLYSGEWAGAMDLTEPQAGTDLGLIRTRATPNADGSYALSGTKIFITWGEHDLASNIVHLVLAKLPDAPAGSKGISMFLVPKFLPDEQGNPGARNPVYCGSLEKKMGIKGSSTCVMNFDGARGWLVGEANQGLACMFTMMNYERLVVGIQAVGVADASYQTALQYARERTQSKAASAHLRSAEAADPIIHHADVKRMLLDMKVANEGSRAFYVYVAQWLDLAKHGEAQSIREQAAERVALLTPVAKAFVTDLAFASALAGQQVLGGHGYVREWGQEQHVRDIRITQIYEGTNGIQAMDLIGRKTVATRGELLDSFAREVAAYLETTESRLEKLGLAASLAASLKCLREATDFIVREAKSDAELPGAVANDYLHLLGLVAYGYLWARMAVSARADSDFARAKIKSAQYFSQRWLSKSQWLANNVMLGAQTNSAFTPEEL